MNDILTQAESSILCLLYCCNSSISDACQFHIDEKMSSACKMMNAHLSVQAVLAHFTGIILYIENINI